MAKANNLVLVGFMGTGKTTIGKLLAEKLSWSYIDTDILIEQKAGLTIPMIFEQYGESYFRDIESEVIKETIIKTQQVISTGGGIVLREQNIKAMKSNGLLICLTATPDSIYERTKSDTYRPLLKVENPKQRIQELLDFRSPFYAKADITIDTSKLPPEEIVVVILNKV
jgi:shikimate kinase